MSIFDCNFLEFLRKLDIYGIEYHFNFEKWHEYRTAFGGLATIMTTLLLIFMSYFYSEDAIFLQNPVLVQESLMYDNFPFYYINTSNFIFAYRLFDYNFTTINDPSYFDFNVTLEKWIKPNASYSQRVLEDESVFNASKCNQTTYSDLMNNETYHRDGFYDFMCINNTFKIGGNWNDGLIYLPNYMITRCSKLTEETKGVKCKTDTEIRERFKDGLFISYFFQENMYDSQADSTNKVPIKTFFHHDYQALNIDNILTPFAPRLKIFFVYKLSRDLMDTNYLKEDKEHSIQNSFLELAEWYSYYDFATDKYLLNVRIHIDRTYTKYSRSYVKILDAFSNVGGISSVFIYFINFFFSFYSENAFKTFLFKSLFRLEYIDDEVYDFSNIRRRRGGTNHADLILKVIDKLRQKELEKKMRNEAEKSFASEYSKASELPQEEVEEKAEAKDDENNKNIFEEMKKVSLEIERYDYDRDNVHYINNTSISNDLDSEKPLNLILSKHISSPTIQKHEATNVKPLFLLNNDSPSPSTNAKTKILDKTEFSKKKFTSTLKRVPRYDLSSKSIRIPLKIKQSSIANFDEIDLAKKFGKKIEKLERLDVDELMKVAHTNPDEQVQNAGNVSNVAEKKVVVLTGEKEKNHNNESLSKSQTIGRARTRISVLTDREKKRIREYKLKKRDIFIFDNCCESWINKCHTKQTNFEKLYELWYAADNELQRRNNIINVHKKIDQAIFLGRFLLNTNQFFMFRNKSFDLIPNFLGKKSNEEVLEAKDLYREDEELRLKKLIDYLHSRVMKKGLEDNDKVLMMFLEDAIKEKLKTHFMSYDEELKAEMGGLFESS